jgi:hypothetical protein
MDDAALIAYALALFDLSVNALGEFLGCQHPMFLGYVRFLRSVSGQRSLPRYIRRSLEAHVHVLPQCRGFLRATCASK